MNTYWCCPDCGMQFFRNETCQSNTNHYCKGRAVQVASPYNEKKGGEMTTRIVDYGFVTESHQENFLIECRSMVTNGWTPHGGVSTCVQRIWDDYGKADRDLVWLTQAFVKIDIF